MSSIQVALGFEFGGPVPSNLPWTVEMEDMRSTTSSAGGSVASRQSKLRPTAVRNEPLRAQRYKTSGLVPGRIQSPECHLVVFAP